MSRVLVISNNLTIKKIFQVISSKLKINFVFKNVLINSDDFDIIVLDDALEHNDIKLTLLNSTKSFGLLVDKKYDLSDSDLNYKFIIKKPFLPQELFKAIKDELENIKKKPKKPLVMAHIEESIDEEIEFLESPVSNSNLDNHSSFDVDNFEFDFDDEPIKSEPNKKTSQKIENSNSNSNEDEILDWEDDLDLLMSGAIEETSNQDNSKIESNNQKSSNNDNLIESIDDISEIDLEFIDTIDSKNKEDLEFEIKGSDIKDLVHILSKYKNVEYLLNKESIKIKIE
jgi:hypothetical protein